MSIEESCRQYRVVNQLLSMHSMLRDEYARRAFFLNTAQIGVSLPLCAFSFVDDRVLRTLGADPSVSRVVVGSAALALLLLAITEFRVDWRGVAARHSDAVTRLARLKAQYRSAQARDVSGEEERLTGEYVATMELLPAVPERRFNRLKARHQFKVALSRQIDANPLAFQWFLWWQLRLSGLGRALHRRRRS